MKLSDEKNFFDFLCFCGFFNSEDVKSREKMSGKINFRRE